MVTPKISLPSTMGKAMMMRMTIDSPTISKMVGRPPTFSNNHDSLQLETCRQDIYKSLRKQKFLFPPHFWILAGEQQPSNFKCCCTILENLLLKVMMTMIEIDKILTIARYYFFLLPGLNICEELASEIIYWSTLWFYLLKQKTL